MNDIPASLFTFLNAARNAPSMMELDAMFAKLIQGWGFDRWTTIPIGSSALGPVRPFEIVFGRPSRDWSSRYRERNYFLHDAAVRTLLQSNEPIWWTSFSRVARLSFEEKRLFDEAREFGIGEGLSTPIRLANHSIWVCALTGEHAAPHDEIADAARMGSERYLLRALELREPDAPGEGEAQVTRAQMEIIRLLARGLNLKQSAHALKLAPSTVYNQIATAKYRMGVKTVGELLRRMTETGRL
ncbi:MAG: autoinducer binding domain-containing protein [Hyphomonadaceae bacterium]|nr:autoinducer binding domain-containing protein [Hyphomonadaceae bacterium]